VLLCELGYEDLILSFGLTHAVINKIIFFSLDFVLSVTVLCFMSETTACLGQGTLIKEIFNLNEAFPG